MKAVYFERHGDPEVLQFGDRPLPRLGDDQVLIEVHAAAVNPRDWMLVAGTYIGGRLVGSPPIIPGSDVSGVVTGVGAKVTGFSVGDEVVAMQSIFGRMGAYAEFIAVKASCVAHKPAEVSHLHAAALPVAGLTAWQALFDLAKVGAGSTVTVVGASGGVGHYAVQLARWAGAAVTAVCGPTNQEFARDLGATLTINYREQDFTELVREQDLVFDAMGRSSIGAVTPTLGPHGFHITTIPTVATVIAGVITRLRGGRRVAPVLVQSRQADLSSLLELMAAGEIRSAIAGVYPLADAAEALRQSRTFHARGKIVLVVRD
jgi:NADPH:quinone reductase-like Zn-dependent oxidoreductase